MTAEHLFRRMHHYCMLRHPREAARAQYHQSISRPLASLREELRDKSVALVGNARRMTEGQGEEIDAHDIVVRMNGAPGTGTSARGQRVDWLASGIAIRNIEAQRYLWTGGKTWQLPFAWAESGRLVMFPEAERERMKAIIGARPSTGAMCVWIVKDSMAARLDLYGFDFFASRSLSSERGRYEGPHNFDGEAGWITGIIAADPRFSIVRP